MEEEKISKKIMWAFCKVRRHFDFLFGDLPIQGAQGRIIHLINVKKEISPVGLAKEMRLRRATITEHLNYLEAKGLIVRSESPDDKRSKIVTLTDKGREMDEIIAKRIRQFDQDLADLFTPEERKQLDNYLTRIAEHYSDAEPPIPLDEPDEKKGEL